MSRQFLFFSSTNAVLGWGLKFNAAADGGLELGVGRENGLFSGNNGVFSLSLLLQDISNMLS
jgi:hypothetical protein